MNRWMPYQRKSIALTVFEYVLCMVFGVAVGVVIVLAVTQ